MRKIIFPAAVVFLLLFSSCQKETDSPSLRSDAKAAPTRLVTLEVTIAPLHGISPDVIGNTYTHNSQNVRAELQDGNSDFYFMSNTSTRLRLRWLSFPFAQGSLDQFYEYRIRAAFTQDLLAMGEGEANAISGTLRVWAYQNKSSFEEFSLRYGIGTDPSASSRVKATRASSNTWILSPETEPSTAELKVGAGTLSYPSPVPFQITLKTI